MINPYWDFDLKTWSFGFGISWAESWYKIQAFVAFGPVYFDIEIR